MLRILQHWGYFKARRQDARVLQEICGWHTDYRARHNISCQFPREVTPCHSSLKFTMETESNSKLPFLRTQLLNKRTHVETKVYVKPTNTGLLLNCKSHVDDRYKLGLLKTMLDRAFRLSFNRCYFSEECDRLKLLFFRLKYPDKLVNSTFSTFYCRQSIGSTCFVTDCQRSNRSHPCCPTV